jgi:hypothetical protein
MLSANTVASIEILPISGTCKLWCLRAFGLSTKPTSMTIGLNTFIAIKVKQKAKSS